MPSQALTHSLVRPMSADELASVRAMVEWREDPETFDRVAGPCSRR